MIDNKQQMEAAMSVLGSSAVRWMLRPVTLTTPLTPYQTLWPQGLIVASLHQHVTLLPAC